MHSKTPLALLGLALPSSLASPATYPSSDHVHPSNGICTDYTVTNTITSQNLIYAYPKFRDNFDVAAHLFNITQGYRDTPEEGPIGYMPFAPVPQNATATYTLAGTFCKPKTEKGGKEKTVLVTTHGLGYDRRYWAPSYQPEKYSYAQVMLDAGYSVFYYDRLGTGQSQKVSGYLNQLNIQVELLKKLVTDIRAGKYTDSIEAEKIALVGHSFGSSVSAGLIAEEPKIAEALILTGFALPGQNDINATTQLSTTTPSVFANRIATPTFPDRDSGYLMFGDIYAHVETFFHQPDYTIETAQYAQSITQPGAVGEFLTLFPDFARSAEFTGKLWIGSGQRDYIVCSGNCDVTFAGEGYRGVWKGVREPRPFVLKGAGHGVNFHLNAQDLFKDILGFLDAGL
ncbi:alpha/beta-hydrolase [Byssothecium circinans]|uniref:Alpha/beta-hydrolase n=1 Tax=Byssothecium circinans TaxID=147558 RepID=A0A6A5U848_9PLEO|nr:alpha/beta-hydrolase [Byssothecium circinans]